MLGFMHHLVHQEFWVVGESLHNLLILWQDAGHRPALLSIPSGSLFHIQEIWNFFSKGLVMFLFSVGCYTFLKPSHGRCCAMGIGLEFLTLTPTFLSVWYWYPQRHDLAYKSPHWNMVELALVTNLYWSYHITEILCNALVACSL